MTKTIGELFPQTVIDYYVEAHEFGRRSYQIMRYIADKLSTIKVCERNEYELKKLVDKLWMEWNGTQHEGFYTNLEYSLRSLCKNETQLSQLSSIELKLPTGYDPYWR